MAKLTLNVEALVSQDLTKRLLFQQAISQNNSACVLALNDIYLAEAKKLLQGKALFVDDYPNDFFLDHKILNDTAKRNALARAYIVSFNSIREVKLAPVFISGMLLLLDQISLAKKVTVFDVLTQWQQSDDEQILHEINHMNVEGLNKPQTDILMAIIQSLGVDRMQSFRSLLKKFWRIHAKYATGGKFHSPTDWIGKNQLVIIPASKADVNSYARLVFNFALENRMVTLIDSDVPQKAYLPFIADLKSTMYISSTKDLSGLQASNLAYQASKLNMSIQSFDAELFTNWLGRYYPALIGEYSLRDFERVFAEFKLAGYLNAFISVEDNTLILIRIDENNQLVKQKFSLKPILEQLDKAIPAKVTKQDGSQEIMAQLQNVLKNQSDLQTLILNKLQEIEQEFNAHNQQQLTTAKLPDIMNDSEVINDEFEKALARQRERKE
ncbi:hypothetical protein [Lactobacillus crispatus]|uniref:hypothetical protein n=1 Tax=Lactobacillus crispatus TaxID=47770 RepID=UPI001060180A|nr:hypothetical protein [Lactobacillus crispatus]TDN08598.1 hypothetical protein CEE83_12955 [Lactobacillus crispatus]